MKVNDKLYFLERVNNMFNDKFFSYNNGIKTAMYSQDTIYSLFKVNIVLRDCPMRVLQTSISHTQHNVQRK